jgi:transposase
VPAAPASLRAVIAALQTLRGIRQLTAATIVCEVGPLSRFTHPRQLMSERKPADRCRAERQTAKLALSHRPTLT